jgi:regulator of nucleoside diphosphate kinase
MPGSAAHQSTANHKLHPNVGDGDEDDPGPTAAQAAARPNEEETIMTTQRKPGTVTGQLNPRITLTAQDHERLSTLARAAANSMPEVAAVLSEELDRAHVLARGRQPEHTVCMGCEVEFRDDTSGKIQTVRLVYPHEADISNGKISVLTPIGTALIGLRAGHSITWETRTGDLKKLTVLRAREPQLA